MVLVSKLVKSKSTVQ